MDPHSYVNFLIVAVMAFIVEAITEYFAGRPFDHIKWLTPFKWILPYFAAAAGIIGAFMYELDVFQIVAWAFGEVMPPQPFGMTLTGLAIGRGSEMVHLLFKFVITWIELLMAKRWGAPTKMQ